MHFDKICRICAVEAASMHSIFNETIADGLRIAELINTLTNISAHEDDELPHQICKRCYGELGQVASFKHKTEYSDREFKLHVQALQQKSRTIVLDGLKNENGEVLIKIEYNPFTSDLNFVDEEVNLELKLSDCDEKPDDLITAQMNCINNGSVFSRQEEQFLTDDVMIIPKKESPKKRQKKFKEDRMPTETRAIVRGASKPYQCTSCKSCFDKHTNLRHHLKSCERRMENRQQAMVNCFDCNAEFKQVSTLTRHIDTKTCLRRRERKSSLGRTYSCAHCKKVCQRRDKFHKHLLVHGFSPKFPCSDCDLEFEQNAMKEHVRLQHTELAHLCPVCGKVFALKNTLRAHMLRHNPDKPFKCKLCPFACVAKTELEAHITKHTGEHPFECDICGHRSTTRSARSRHKRIHTGEKKHVCDLCPKRFAVAYGLKKHRRTHTGEKPYACDQCDRTFTQRTDWVWHKKHHIEGYQFQCTLCPEAFISHSMLKVHRSKVHKGWKQEKAAATAAIAGIILKTE